MTKRLVVGVCLLASGVLALPGVSGATAKPGTYAGSTSSNDVVGLVVSAGGKSVTGFSTKDGYNGVCRYKFAAGGFLNFTINIPKMKISTAGTFGETLNVVDPIFKEKGTLQVSGKVSGSHVTGAVTWPGETCGKGAANPNAFPYDETFTAKRT